MLIYIAEDEPLAAAKLKLFLEKAGVEGTITLFGDGAALLEAMGKEPFPDVIFLDIQMPNLTGIQFLEALQREEKSLRNRPGIIITSAYDQYAIDGFNFGVTDYLLKPYTLDRLRQAIAKLRITDSGIAVQNTDEMDQKCINLRCEGRTERVPLAKVVCVEAVKDYTTFVLADGRRLTSLGTLGMFEQQLPLGIFQRVQRSYIVNLNHVESFTGQFVRLANGMEVPLGKTYRESFEKAVNLPQ